MKTAMMAAAKGPLPRWPICFAGISGALAVFLAAGAAHDLKHWLGAEDLERIHTAVRYQIWHALALLATAALSTAKPSPWLHIAALGFALGSVLFCSGLYLTAFTGQAIFGWLAPFGGLAFIAGWLAIAVHGWRSVQT
ncbi:MAG: DUF423 domain-containing protein [Alphaproteobacteria bacterium]|jgi:uncharacterized membrane protein YgdD (TMEM256/DUF423 family)|nr:DUF423 domain-containing protein [Alphaproteobacteria bacterium]